MFVPFPMVSLSYDRGYPIAIRGEVAEFQEIVVERKQRNRILGLQTTKRGYRTAF